MSTEEKNGYVLLPAISGGGVLALRSQIIGARPNGPDGAIVYTAAGPSLYTSLTTRELASIVDADVVEKQRE